MAAEPITFSTTLHSTAAVDELLTRLRQLPWGPSARLDEPNDQTLRVSSGSKLRYRLLGARAGGKHLPLKAVFELDSGEVETSVRVTMASNEGWYLVQTSLARGAYQERFDELLAAIQADGIVEHP